MIIKRIDGATRTLGVSQGLLGLPVRDEKTPCGKAIMRTSWEPTPEELAALNKGANVEVTILGSAHSPILLSVGKVPE